MPVYNRIKYWVENYAITSSDDKRAVEDFIECETREIVSAFRAELIQIVSGNFSPETLQVLIGGGRSLKYGSFDEWAKMMLLWIANYRTK